jgi:hypothetical protein
MATERGWIEATTTCPTCSGTNKIVVFGGNGDIVSKTVKCSTDDVLYSAVVTITFTASVANYAHSQVGD